MYYQRFKTADERFNEKYTVAQNGCWLWKTGVDAKAYPKFRGHDGRHQKASHFSWQRANGRKLFDGEQVLHECDTPRCVNPDHLFLGSQSANMQDRAHKGRGNHRITRFIAGEIRRLYAAGDVSQQRLAKKFGVAQTTVSCIVRNQTWNGST